MYITLLHAALQTQHRQIAVCIFERVALYQYSERKR